MTTREKKLIAIGAGAGVLIAVLALGALGAKGMLGALETRFFPAAPNVVATQPAPGAQPVAGAASSQGTQPGTTVELSPAEITAAGVQVAEVRSANLKTDIDAFGRVEQPESQLSTVSAWIGGRIDKLYVQYTGELVRHGQPVAEVYSPEVATALEEYRLAQENRNHLSQSDDAFARQQADALVTASQRRLELWGISGRQIQAPATAGVPHVTIYANSTGTVVERKVAQGQYVNAGETMFTLADLSQVWIMADVYEEQLPQIHQGQEVEITAESLPNRTLHGHVDFIEPAANQQTRTVSVHLHVANPGMRLLPGMYVSTKILSRASQPTIVIPRSAVLDTGTRKIVYLAKPNGVFEAREIQVGAPSDDLFPVSSGLAIGDKVVVNGNFLIDSQAHLSSGMSGLYGGSKEFSGGSQGQAPGAGAQGKNAEAGAAQIEFHADADPLKGGADNPFHVKLTDASGKPIANAHVTVTLIMPAMPSMNMPEMKNSFELPWVAAQRMYAGNGQPPTAGTWNVLVEATKNGSVIASAHTHLSAR